MVQLFEVLRQQKLFGKFEKCIFMLLKNGFLGFIISKDGIKVNPEKVEVIRSWPITKIVIDVHTFHG